MNSALFEGDVTHRRFDATEHTFSHRLFMSYVDLDELPGLFARRPLWSVARPLLAWFRRRDYMAPHDRPLREVVLDRVERELGRRPTGAVRMLTHLRTLGYVFNPVTFYYCFDEDDRLAAVAAEITNTPWRERFTYVLGALENGKASERFAKAFHVSPFFDMELEYDWRFETPDDSLRVSMTSRREGRSVFHVGLECERRELTPRNLVSAVLRHPFLTFRVHLAIYWQALRLWWKRTPFHVHPKKRSSLPETT